MSSSAEITGFNFASERSVFTRISIVSTYSDVFRSSAFASRLCRKSSPVNGLGISASMGRTSASEPPNIIYAYEIASCKDSTGSGGNLGHSLFPTFELTTILKASFTLVIASFSSLEKSSLFSIL